MPLDFNTLLLTILLILVVLAIVIGVIFLRRFFMRREIPGTREQPREQVLGGRYRIGYELGRGMNAVTFQVEDRKSPETSLVAKVLLTPEDDPRITQASFRRHIERFRREGGRSHWPIYI